MSNSIKLIQTRTKISIKELKKIIPSTNIPIFKSIFKFHQTRSNLSTPKSVTKRINFHALI